MSLFSGTQLLLNHILFPFLFHSFILFVLIDLYVSFNLKKMINEEMMSEARVQMDLRPQDQFQSSTT